MNNFLNDFFNLAGKTVLITGASGQLGTKLTEAYVAAGCKVIGMDLNKPAGDYAGVDFYEGSIAIKKDVEILMTTVFEKYNGLDILINNASIDHKVPSDLSENIHDFRFENFDFSSWQNELAVGLTGAVYCCKYATRIMIKNKSGIIINISSDLGVIAPDQRIYKKSLSYSNDLIYSD